MLIKKTATGFELIPIEVNRRAVEIIEKLFKKDTTINKKMVVFRKGEIAASLNLIRGLGDYLTVDGKPVEIKKIVLGLGFKERDFQKKVFNELMRETK